jgi:hypothetical protein
MNYFDSDMSNRIKYSSILWLEDDNLYLRLRTMSHTIYASKFEQTIVSRIDGASITIILCLHVLIAGHILLILDMLIIFSEYRCIKH